jgi:hypothetical protein
MLTRAEILDCTDNGREVFRRFIGAEPKAGRNFQNPFVEKQQTPSFNLYQGETGEWRYNDFATGDRGSWLDFVMELHHLTVPEALVRIEQELGLLEGTGGHTQPPINRSAPVSVNKARPFRATYREALTSEEIAFWEKYGICPDILEKYGVRALEHYTATRVDGSNYRVTVQAGNPTFAYDAGEGFVKTYAPLTTNKGSKFAWPTGRPAGYVFGLAQLTDWSPVILLAAGEKDAIVLSAHGYAAVTVGSEHSLISSELVAELRSRCDEVLICYDADETGLHRAKELSTEHGLRWIELPAEVAPGKDAADFYQAVYEKRLKHNLLQEAIVNAHAPGQTELEPVSLYEPQLDKPDGLPMFPPEVYQKLPDYLQRVCSPFEGRSKDVVLVGTLGVTSGCFPGVESIYAQRRTGLNLFTFISAPAASGKGDMGWAHHLGRHCHKQLTSESNAQLRAYEADMQASRTAGKGKNAVPVTSAPPPRRMLFLPGDTTAAALLGALAENDECGIIFESEADTLASAMGGEHGKFGDKLCKIFHHEPIPLIRKGEKLYLDIERPKVSIVLSGTPAQIARLMPNPENGLVSRFLFYCFESPYVWRSGAPDGRLPLDPYFDELSEELTRMIAATPGLDENDKGGVEVTLSQADWARLDACGEIGLDELAGTIGEAGASSAFRLGFIAFRLIGLLTVFRCFENGEAPAGQVEADPQDVTTALLIINTLRAHALHVLATMPRSRKPRSTDKFMDKVDKQTKAIELHNTGMSVRKVAAELGVSKSTVHDWVKSDLLAV